MPCLNLQSFEVVFILQSVVRSDHYFLRQHSSDKICKSRKHGARVFASVALRFFVRSHAAEVSQSISAYTPKRLVAEQAGRTSAGQLRSQRSRGACRKRNRNDRIDAMRFELDFSISLLTPDLSRRRLWPNHLPRLSSSS